MGISKIAAAAFGAFLCTGSASVALAQQAPAGTTQSPPRHPARHGSHAGLLTPEERFMWRMAHRAEIKAMTPTQRRAYRQQFRQQLLAMTPSQRAQLHEQLQAQWNHLPQQRQQAIEQRIAEHRERDAGHASGQADRMTHPAASGTYSN